MENQRIRLSKTLLKNALVELLRVKRIDKISISELCEAAQINRTTFYKYYGSQYDLLSEMEQDFFQQLQQNFLDKNPEDMENLIAKRKKEKARSLARRGLFSLFFEPKPL